MRLKIKNVSPLVEREVNKIADYFSKQFGCVSTLSEEVPNGPNSIAIEVTLPKNKQIFLPVSHKIDVFCIDTARQVLTVIYFPEVLDKEEVLAN